MTPGVGFVSFLVVTLALLGGVVLTGKRARRPAHLSLVALSVLSLGTTIWFAEQLGELYDLESAGAITPVHLFLAKVTVFAYLLPVVTGIRTLRDKARGLRVHRFAAYTVLVLTGLTAATGGWMILASERLETPASTIEAPGKPGAVEASGPSTGATAIPARSGG